MRTGYTSSETVSHLHNRTRAVVNAAVLAAYDYAETLKHLFDDCHAGTQCCTLGSYRVLPAVVHQ